MRAHSLKWNTWLGLALFSALAFSFAGCGGSSAPDEDAEWVAENAGADTANVQPTQQNAEAPAAEVQPADAQAAQSTPPADAAAAPAVAPDVVTPAAPAADDAQTQEAAPQTAEEPPSAATTGEVENYAVKKGDTLMKVAFNVYGDISRWRDIYAMNKDSLKSANSIYPGMQLKYEKPAAEPSIEHNGDSYLIKQGDTLGSIADDIYAKRSKWKKIYENNKTLIQNPNRIYAGFYLYYQMTEEERSWAEKAKANRQALPAQQRLGDTAAPAAAPEAAAGGVPASAAPVQQASAAPAGGLSNLAAPQTMDKAPQQQDRAPTATQ